MAIPATPVSMITQPTTWMFSHDGWPWTAKARIAPSAIKNSPVAVLMTVPPLRGTCLPASRRSAWPAVVVLAEHVRPQVAERTCEQPGHVHLRYAKPFPDLGLGHVAVEAHHQQALLTLREIGPVRPDGLHVQGVLELRIVLAEYVGQVPWVRPAGPWRVQRGRLEGEVGALRVTQLVVADPQVLRQLVVVGYTGELLGQVGADPA